MTVAVTIAIKAYNEADNIAAAIESALAAIAELGGGEVVLADCASTDGTAQIASRYPIRVLSLAKPDERSCGAGAQLAYQGVRTEFFYLMDGDMTLIPGFLPQALAWLQAHPDFAGVGGNVKDRYLENAEFLIREASLARDAHRREGPVDRLDGGGLYRAAAIEHLGYFADPALRSFEEFELAARLGVAGWKMARIDVDAVLHSGHRIDGLSLMWYRFTSGQMGGAGTLLRAALGKPHWRYTLAHLRQVRAVATVTGWWMLLLAGAIAGAWLAVALLVVIPAAFLGFRRRSLKLGLYSFLVWNLAAIATLRSFVEHPRRSSLQGKQLAFTVLHEG
ncbi:glycosyltransferase [Novosphingobium colocasiae]|uniref:Glycosyl transferase n=1 Tax=Novosphingobium colocasiae TaxID=1256513 RepID=A0A918PBM5_9SPHN|nr:glycosyltransferase family A protein [Novosphingobium colocasiae]GGY96503.1 glycosyl transferase [Novosphingobium colocasiae]